MSPFYLKRIIPAEMITTLSKIIIKVGGINVDSITPTPKAAIIPPMYLVGHFII